MTISTQGRHDRKRTAFYYPDDGLVEIYIGLIVLSFGILILTDLAWMSGVFAAVFLPVWLTAKHSLMSTRLTDTELEHTRVNGTSEGWARLLIPALLGLIAGLVLFILLAFDLMAENWRLWISNNFSILAGMFGGIVLAIVGVVTGASRFYGYAVLSAAIVGIGSWLGVEFPLAVVALGAIILGVGVVFLIHFLRTHPRIKSEQDW